MSEGAQGLVGKLREAASAANTLSVGSAGPSRAWLLGQAADELDKLQGINPEAVPDLLAACVEFVRKCENREARSKRSYAQMKAAIAKAGAGQ